MKREIRYQKRHLNKIRRLLFCLVLFIFLFVGLLSCTLNYHLFQIQNVERVARFKNYEEFRIDFQDKNSCDVAIHRLVYEDEENRFYVDCKNPINVYYGSSYTSIENAFSKKYLTLKLLLSSTNHRIYEQYHEYTRNDLYTVKIYSHEEDKSDVYIEAL